METISYSAAIPASCQASAKVRYTAGVTSTRVTAIADMRRIPAPVPLHFACAPATFGCIVRRMARDRKKEPGSTTAAFRNLLQREDLTMKIIRRRTNFVLIAAIGALALVG